MTKVEAKLMPKSWCPHLKASIDVAPDWWIYTSPFRCACGRPIGQQRFLPDGTVGEEVLSEMPVVGRPPTKAGNFFKAAMFKGDSVRVTIKNVRPDQQLPAGPATILDFSHDGQDYGFPLNATNHKKLCALYGDVATLTFDTKNVIGKSITLKKVMAPNPKQGGQETESLRIA